MKYGFAGNGSALAGLTVLAVAPYAEMYIHDNANPETLTLQNTWYKVTDTWTADDLYGFSADIPNAQLICHAQGIYHVTTQINFQATPNASFQFAIFLNGVEQVDLAAHSIMRGVSQTISVPILGVVALIPGDILDLRVQCVSAAGTTVTVIHVNLTLHAIGAKLTAGLAGAYGEIHIDDNAATQALALQNTFYQITTGWTVGLSAGTTPSALNSNIVINTKGVYHVNCSISMFSSAANQVLEFSIFKNGVYQPNLSAHFTSQTARGESCGLSGMLELALNDTIDLRVQNTTSAGKTVTAEDVNLNCSAILINP